MANDQKPDRTRHAMRLAGGVALGISVAGFSGLIPVADEKTIIACVFGGLFAVCEIVVACRGLID